MRIGRVLDYSLSIIFVLALTGGTSRMRAGTINSIWNGGTGNWSTASDWNPAMVPNNGTPVGDTYEVTIDSGFTQDVVSLDINATISSLVLGGATSSSTLQNASTGSLPACPPACTLEVTGATTINATGVLEFNSASALKFDGGLTVGGNVSPFGGTFSLNDATATVGTTTAMANAIFNSGSTVSLNGGSTLTVNGNLTNNSPFFSTSSASYVGGNAVIVSGGFTNNGTLTMYGNAPGGPGDTLTVTGTLTNGSAASLNLVDNSGDVANIGMLSNSGNVYVGLGTILNLTNQPNGITDVPAHSALTVYGSLTAGSANGLAKLASVEGALTIGNAQTTTDTPGPGITGTLMLQSGGSLTLNNYNGPGTTLSVTGGLNDSGSATVVNGSTLSMTQSMTLTSVGSLALAGGGTLIVSGNLTNNSTGFSTGYAYPYFGGGNTLTVKGGFTNTGTLIMYGEAEGGPGDTLNVTGALTNTATGNVTLYDNSGDLAKIGSLSNSGTVYVGTGTTLNLTNQTSGITDVPLASTLTVKGTLTAGSANGLAQLTSVEGNVTLENGQTTTVTPAGDPATLSVSSGGGLTLSSSPTVLSVNGALNNSGSLNVQNGAALSTTGITLNSGSFATLTDGATLTVNGTLTNGSANFSTGSYPYYGGNTLTVNGGFTNNGTLTMNGASPYYGGGGDKLNVTGTLANGTTGVLNLVDGSYDVANVGALTNSGTIYVGLGTTLNLTNQSSGITDVPLGSALTVKGTLTAGSANGLAQLTSVEGNLALENGQTTSATPTVNSTLSVSSGGILTLNTSTTLSVNGALDNSGTVNVQNGAALSTQGLTLESGSSTVLTAGATLTVNGTLANNSASFSTGSGYPYFGGDTVTVNGGFTNNGTLTMYGTGDKLNVTGTLINAGGASLTLADNSGDVASVGTLTNSGTFYIGAGTTLNLTNQSNGITDVPSGSALTVNGTVTAGSANGLAKLASVEGSLTLGNRQTTADTPGTNLAVNAGGVLDLTHTGTTLSVTGGTTVADSGSVSVSNGAILSLTQNMTLSSGSIMSLAGGGALTVSGNLTNNSGGFSTGSPGGNKVTVKGGFTNAGVLTMYGGSSGGKGDVLSVTGTLTNKSGATIDLVPYSGDLASAGKLSNAGTITISKGTKLTVANNNSYTQSASTGTTTVDGTLVTTGTGGIQITGGNLFGNNGNLNGNTTIGASTGATTATLNIGDLTLTAGKETVTGTYTQASKGILDIDVGGLTAGFQFDQLTVTGAASLNGTLNLDLINAFVPTIGSMFDILNASTLNGTMFTTVTGTGINSNEHFTVIYNPTNVTLDVVSGMGPLAQNLAANVPANSATPEPASLLLLGTGLVGLAGLLRCRRLGVSRLP